ncbi:helix-turn-helix domain-containing protein [Nonomuraea dietziae]|uniref:helix-turn-helix domain-containing protein n=1 Tax=Nonomuraea dietziae TaxID=65515 RepID=UPI0033D1FC18
MIGVLRGEQPLTLTDVAGRTGLSRASTEDVVRELMGKGWVAEAAPVAGGVGRPARRYRFRADAGRVMGVDIGGHKVLVRMSTLGDEGVALGAVRPAIDHVEEHVLDVRGCLAGAGRSAGSP